ncbi:serine protease 27-like [Erpetoichthys calabaricus]|nr:serine protease 27-like [Erpetoichthys calabaricus]
MCFFSPLNVSLYQVELGLLFKNGTGAQTVTRGLKNIFIHPNYTNYVTGNDVALLQLQQPVNYTNVIRPVCLPRKSDVFTPKDDCWVTGWGAISIGALLPNTGPLQQLNVTIIPNADCDRMYNNTKQNASLPMILDNMMCAGYAEGGKDACNGDNGGPLVCRRRTDGSWVQAGIVSWGYGCGIPNKPVIYTRVSSVTAWIQKMTNITIEAETTSVLGSGVVRLQKPAALLALLLLLISFILSLI